MTSFFADTIAFIPHEPETLAALLSTLSSFMNSSIVPVILSSDDIWDSLCKGGRTFSKKNETGLLSLFSSFSDTMQFTSKLTHHFHRTDTFIHDILEHLISTKRYFGRTLQHLDLVSGATITLTAGKLHNVNSIDLKRCTLSLSDNHIDLLSNSYPLLRELDLTGILFITDVCFKHIAKLKQLRKLGLKGSRVKSLNFLKQFKYLISLNLKGCRKLCEDAFHSGDDDGGLVVLPSLREINVFDCSGVTSVTFEHLGEIAPSLSSLECNDLKSGSLDAISKMSNLHCLNISDTPFLAQGSTKALAQNLHHLEELTIANATGFNQASLFQLSEAASPIKKLKIERCPEITVTGLMRVVNNMKYLETLEINESSGFTFVGETGDVEEVSAVTSSLKELRISGAPKLSSEGLTSIMRSLTSLQTLVLNHCPKISSTGLKTALLGVNNGSCLTTIQTLVLVDTPGIVDFSFLEGLKGLKKFHFSGSQNVDESPSSSSLLDFRKGFKLLSASGVELEELNLSNTEIDDDQLSSLSPEIMKRLKFLSINYCRKLTRKSIVETVSKMSSLQELEIKFEPSRKQFSIEDAEFIAAKLPRLTRLVVNVQFLWKIDEDYRLNKKLGHIVHRERVP